MNSKTKEHDNKDDNLPNIVSVIGMFIVMPLIGIGLLGHAFTAITQDGWFALLSLLAFILGFGGLALSFSKGKYVTQIGTGLIMAAAALSFWYKSVAVLPNETSSMAMIMTGTVIAIIFATFDFMMKQLIHNESVNEKKRHRNKK